jgi:hypothetical protein
MAHGGKDDPRCPGTWAVSGEACRHVPRPGHDTCAAHDPTGDQRREPLEDELRCTATNKESGERCRLAHPPGGSVCYRHGGQIGRIRRAAKARATEQEARAMVATYGLPIEISAEQAILEEIHRTAGHVAWLAEQVRALDENELVWGVTRVKEGGEDRGTTQEAVPNAYLKLYMAERAHLAKICADAIRAGIADRQVKLAEQQGVLVARALKAILDGLNLTAAQRALALTVVPEQLRALQATALTN